jgi:hypothetical protein
MLSFVGSTIGKIFGTDKAAESLVNNTVNALDKLVYTKEEQAEDDAKDRQAARVMIINWMAATSGQNLARRLLALMITTVWLGQYIVIVVISSAIPWIENADKYKYKETVVILGGFTEQMNGAVMLILAFYFAAPHMGSIVNGALSKFGNTKQIK